MSNLKRLVFYTFFLFLIGSFGKTFAQGTSNKGTDFWLGYGTHINHNGNTPETMVVYITSDVNTTATVEVSALTFSQLVPITANVVSTVTIPLGAHLGVEGLSKMGIHISAIKPIIVYSHIYASSVSGATLVLPTNTLGKDYYSINYKQVSNSNNSASFFFVVAVEDYTEVEITPSQNTQGGWLANTVHKVSLNKGEIYHVMGAYTNTNGTLGVDLTGSKIKSVSSSGVCKKIAVFSGSSKISISCFNNTTAGSADNLFQQVYPTATWGKKFITVPLKDRNFDVIRIFKSDPTAVVTLNGIIIPVASFVNNLYYDFESQAVNNISSDKPIQTIQYAVTQGRGINCTSVSNDVGDPEMIFLNPLEQTLTQITMYSSPNYLILKHFINVVVKNEGVASFKVDGVSKSTSFVPVTGNTAYSCAQISVVAGTHKLVCDFGFNAIAYGFGSAESYGYAAGASLTAFGIETIDDVTAKDIQTGCQDQPLTLNLKLPYEPTEIYLDKGDGAGYVLLPISPLLPTVVDGQITYYYSLIKNLIYNIPNTYPYKVKVIKPTRDNCGTGDEFSFDLIINPKPVANFTAPTKVCLNDASAFVYVADPLEPAISNYLWDFNGEGSSVLKDPTFTFLTAGIKKVKFSTKSTLGCWSNVVEKSVEIMPLPVVKFKVNSPTCETKDILFTNQSTTLNGVINKWEWIFDDPASAAANTSILENPTHLFATAKTYNVTLKVTTDLGCVQTIFQDVTINPLPKPDFESPDVCINNPKVTFTNKTSISDNATLTYVWDFGEPSSGANNASTLINPTHTYSLPNNYQVKLIVKSIAGCEAEIIKSITVNPKPVADFAASAKSCFKDVLTFNYLPDANVPNISDYLWDFNGEGSDIVAAPTYTFAISGIKKIRFSTKSDKGCWSDIKEKSLEVFALPSPKFSTSTILCPEVGINFSDLSTTIGQTITQWRWNFDDSSSSSNTSTLQNPVHIFSAAKTYQVSLTVITDLGCTKTMIQPVTIEPLPVPNFETPDICLDDALAAFTNKTTISDNSTLTYLWDFGDPISNANNTSTLKNPSHKYTKSAIYQVKLAVKSAKGCDAILIKTFTVNGSTPKASFVVPNDGGLCSDQKVVFEDYSFVDFGEITKIEWIYDDATPTVVEVDNSPALRSAAAKKYFHQYPVFYTPAQRLVVVKMKAYSGKSATCQSTVTKQIILKAVPIVNFSLPDGCLTNGDAQFSDLSTFLGSTSGLTYSWDFGDPLSGSANSSDVKNPIHHYQSSKDYVVNLVITASNGCTATLTKTFTVKGAVAQPVFEVTNANDLCSNQTVIFNDMAKISFGEITKIEWYFDIDNHLNDPAYQFIETAPALRSNPSRSYSFNYPIFNAPLNKNYNVKMKLFSGSGCVNEIVRSITLKAVPNVVFTSLAPVCEEVPPYQITQAKETSGFIGNGLYTGKGISAKGVFSPLMAGVGNHTITYTFTGANGCIDEKKQDITVFPTPFADAGLDETILIGDEIKIKATASGNNITYKWTPALGLDLDDILNPLASPKESTRYTLMVTSADGCVYADEIFIKVLQYPVIPNTFTPNNDGVNDTWVIKYLEDYPSSSIKIFNREGQQVYKLDRYFTPWDGKVAGVDLPQGMYYYIVTANDGQLKYSGSVMLVR